MLSKRAAGAVSSLRQSHGARGEPIPGNFFDLVSRLHSCAKTSDSTANEGLLTAQACPLSEASLSRQQIFGTPCVLALADSILCCCTNWILKMTAVLFCLERCPTEVNGSYVSCAPHSCQVKTVSAALFCLYSAVIFTD